MGMPEQALQLASDTVKLGKKLNHPFSYAMCLFFGRQIFQFSGMHDEARERIEEEYKACNEGGFVFFEVHAILGRGEILLRQGKADEARQLFQEGLQMLHATGGNLSMDHPYRNIAEAYIEADLLEDAQQWLDRGFQLVITDHFVDETHPKRLVGRETAAGKEDLLSSRRANNIGELLEAGIGIAKTQLGRGNSELGIVRRYSQIATDCGRVRTPPAERRSPSYGRPGSSEGRDA